MRTKKSQVPLPLILSVGLFESDKYFETEASEHEHHEHHDREHHDHSACTDEHHEHHHHHEHHSNHLENDGFTSISFQSDKPFAIKKFQHFLDSQLPSSVFRAKGILWFDESPQRHIFHLCGKRFTIEDEEWKTEPKNQVVLIGQDLDHEQLKSQLEKCICLPSSNRGKGFGK